MLNNIISSKTLHLLIAIIVAILTTGFLRLQLFSGLPEADGGVYTFASQYIYNHLLAGEAIANTPLYLYQFLTSWVYGLEVNQYVLLRLIDGLVAIAASVILFKVILKESGSNLFTVILMAALLIIMNDIEIILYGFRNSIWAAFLPLFSALLIWQNSYKEDKYSFYLIGGLVSLGVLLREPFLPFFLFSGFAILIAYGWRLLIKYLIGSAVVGFSILGFMLMFRGWDLIDLINSYLLLGGAIESGINVGWKFPWQIIIKANWFIIFTATASILYILKLNFNKKFVNLRRFYFWAILVLIPLIEYWSKLGLPYHMANCLIGLAGLSALGWSYLQNNETIRANRLSLIILGVMSMFIILPTVNNNIIKSSHTFTISDAIRWTKSSDSFRSKNMIERSQYIKVAAKVYSLSRENSTMAVSSFWQGIYPLTKLPLPKSSSTGKSNFNLSTMRALYINYGYDKNKMVQLLKDYQPTMIVTSIIEDGKTWRGEEDMPEIIMATNLYEIVDFVPQQFTYEDFYITQEIQKLSPGIDPMGWMPATIWRLKDFK
tara:strand:- start:8559 stop:10196 length:1638 start_codon:yes stop_codon:yes gene_type:complete